MRLAIVVGGNPDTADLWKELKHLGGYYDKVVPEYDGTSFANIQGIIDSGNANEVDVFVFDAGAGAEALFNDLEAHPRIGSSAVNAMKFTTREEVIGYVTNQRSGGSHHG